MPKLKAHWDNVLTTAKWLGLVLLGVYCFVAPIEVHLAWSAAYVVLSLIVFPLLTPLFQRLFQFQSRRSQSSLDSSALATGAYIRNLVQRKPWELILAAGEDGVFFLPLVYFGISPVLVLIVSFVYGLVHYPLFPLWACIMKWAFFFVVGLLILPHGIMTVVVGHIANNCLMFFLTPHLQRLVEALKKPHDKVRTA